MRAKTSNTMLDPKCFMWDHSGTLDKAEEFFSLNPEGIIPVSIRNAGSIVVQFPVRNTYAMKTLLHLIQQDYPNRLNQKSGFSQVESNQGVCILEPVSDRFIEDILQPACL